MHPKLKPHKVVRKLKEKRMNLFTPLDFKRVFGVSNWACQWFIKTHNNIIVYSDDGHAKLT